MPQSAKETVERVRGGGNGEIGSGGENERVLCDSGYLVRYDWAMTLETVSLLFFAKHFYETQRPIETRI